MIPKEILARVRDFIRDTDPDTLRETAHMLLGVLENPDTAPTVEDAFYRDLEFGTGGLRGIMGPGTNRMNRDTVSRATQGLSAYVARHSAGKGSIVIAYDSRNRSSDFARDVASVIAGNGLTAYLFEDVRPTPELSFAVRHLGATAGIVITASHNPKEYNGYKVSWSDGAQVIAPHDKGIINEVRSVTAGSQVHRADFAEACKDGRIRFIGKDVDEAFFGEVQKLNLRKELTKSRGGDLKIVYTPLHGVGVKIVPEALRRWGFSSVFLEPEQAQPNGNFPTVKSPNPEEPAALERSLALAKRENADIVIATDPDADRIGIAVRHGGEYVLLTGNQVGALFAYYLCETHSELGIMPASPGFITTVVTTGLIETVGRAYGVPTDYCLTGFKWIAGVMRQYEAPGGPTRQILMGCEESYGYLIGQHCRDKDAVGATCVAAEFALWAKQQGKSLVDVLHDLYARHGVHVETQLAITMPGKTGMEAIAAIMSSLRANPPKAIAGIEVAEIIDLGRDLRTNPRTGGQSPGPGLPSSDVLSFQLADGSRVVARPSGTEPKVKFYFMVVDSDGAPFTDKAVLEKKIDECRKKEQALRADFERVARGRVA